MTASKNIQEEWHPVVGYEGLYQVSSFGRVRSILIRPGTSGRPKILKACAQSDGYLVVAPCRNGKAVLRMVHRLVLEAFIGPCPEGHEAAHLDGDRSSPKLENLRWVTHSENQSQMIGHGKSTRGEKHPMAKLTARQVHEIRRLAADGVLHREIGAKYGVARRTVTAIAHRKIWRHI